MTLPFGSEADFSGITKQGFAITNLIQKGHLDVKMPGKDSPIAWSTKGENWISSFGRTTPSCLSFAKGALEPCLSWVG